MCLERNFVGVKNGKSCFVMIEFDLKDSLSQQEDILIIGWQLWQRGRGFESAGCWALSRVL